MGLKDISSEYTSQWCNSINEIDRTDWIKIFGNSQIKAYDFFYTMEQSNFPNVEYHYLLVRKQGVIVSIIPCFCYHLDLLQLVTSHSIQLMIKSLRCLLPGFFKLRTFVTGSYAATCEHFIEYNHDLNQEETSSLAGVLNRQLKKKYQNTNSQILFIKDVRERDIDYIRKILDEDIRFFVSFPTTAIPVFREELPYPQALRKKNRKRYKIFKEKFKADFTWEIITDFESYIPLLTELYQNVLDKAKNKFEVLNGEFFHNINKSFPDTSFLLVAKDKNGEIRLVEIVLEENDRLLPLYLGIKYADDDTKVLYLNAIFRTVEEAEVRGKELLDFGQTSYYPKVMSGAMVENIYYGFWSDKFFLKRMIRHLFKKIFLSPLIPENVYLSLYKEKACKLLENKGFVLLNK